MPASALITDLRNHLYEATLRRSSSFFHKHRHGHDSLHADQRCGPRADRGQLGASANFCSSSSPFWWDCLRDRAGRRTQLGAVAVYSGGGHFGAQDRQRSAHPHPHRPGQAGRDPEHSARNGDRQPHREGIQHRAVGDSAFQESGASDCSAPICAACASSPSVRR